MNTIAKHVAVPFTLAAVFVAYGTSGAAEDHNPGQAGPDVQTCLPPGHVRVDGYVGQRMDDCMENLIMAWDLDRLVKPFRDKTDGVDDQWRSDFWGKWFTALVLGYAHQPTPAHRQHAERALNELLATQGADGNIGSFEGRLRLIGAYDVWGRQCVILGLVAYYDATGDKKALDAACRVLDCLIDEVKQRQVRIPDLSWPDFKGLAPSVIVESGALLYVRTGIEKYRKFSEEIVAQWHEPGKLAPNGIRLVDDAIAGKSAIDIGYPKAYEQIYCFITICEMYRATGDRKYLDAAVALAKSVRDEELFITGSGSQGEHWFKGRSNQTKFVFNPAETCVTAHWMYLSWHLLQLTGEPVYADDLETSLYNSLLGALLPDGHWWGYYDPLVGWRVPSWVAQADIGSSCCIGSGCRGLMLTPFWAVMQAKDGPVVNLFFAGKFDAKTPSGASVALTMETDYPREGTVRLSVAPAKPESFTIALRIPAWSEKSVLKVNGEEQPVQPGNYAKLERQWTAGDTIELSLDMRTRVFEAPDGNGQLALQRGPIVLALDDRFVPAEKETVALLERSEASLTEVKPNPQAAERAGSWMAFDVPFVVNGKKTTLTMCDYASAGNRWSKSNRFRTWLPQPLDLGSAYETGDAWHSCLQAPTPDLQAERGAGADDLALASKGATATADSEYEKEPYPASQVIDGHVAGPWDFSNRWVSSNEKAHPHWIEVKLKEPATIGTIVIRFADPAGYPTSFEGLVRIDGKDFTPVFDQTDNKNPRYYRATIAPVVTDTFRLVVRASANPAYPNAAQISEIELYPPASQAEPATDALDLKADRILFLGNSITLTPSAAWCDWQGNWGMAASAAEKDYVHLVTNAIAQRTGRKPDILAVNIADFERNLATYDVDAKLKEQLAFKPDIVVVAIGENVAELGSDESKAQFKNSLLKLLTAVKNNGQPNLFVRSCFWTAPTKDEILRQACDAVGGVFVDLGGLDKDESNYARSERKYTHDGVAAHPGDKGMKAIADALLTAMGEK